MRTHHWILLSGAALLVVAGLLVRGPLYGSGLSLKAAAEISTTAEPPAAPPAMVSPAVPRHRVARVEPLPIDGLWIPSGFMGDAETGALSYEIAATGFASAPSCERWSYDAAAGSAGWVGVAYQYPASNWGSAPGMDLAGRGFTHLRFMARGQIGGERLLMTCGGQTAPGAAYPATFERRVGAITLTTEWQEFRLALGPRADLSNTVSALTIVVNRVLAPDGCTIFIDDIAFVGLGPGSNHDGRGIRGLP